MPNFVCKRHRRSAPGAATGVVIDEYRFPSDSAEAAELKIRRGLLSRSFGQMDWEKYFATLEDEDGHILVTWLHGVLHA